jgi:hypothetical protein
MVLKIEKQTNVNKNTRTHEAIFRKISMGVIYNWDKCFSLTGLSSLV